MMLPLAETGKTEGWKVVLEWWGKGADGISEQRGPGDDCGNRSSLRQLCMRMLEPDC